MSLLTDSNDYFLVYTSGTDETLDVSELEDLVGKAQTFNDAHGITGMLVYSDDVFVQVLEGQREIISSLYERIEQDERHTSVTIIASGELATRRFSDWSMGFEYAVQDKSGGELKHIKAVEDLFESAAGKELVALLSELDVVRDSNLVG